MQHAQFLVHQPVETLVATSVPWETGSSLKTVTMAAIGQQYIILAHNPMMQASQSHFQAWTSLFRQSLQLICALHDFENL